MAKKNEIRWVQRFRNYEHAFMLLRDGLEKKDAELSDLEKEGLIQRFEYTFELAWKTLRNYMEHDGHTFSQISPKRVVKKAFSCNYIADGKAWIEMVEQRNLMSHTYDKKKFDVALALVRTKYLDLFDKLYMMLKEKSL